MGIGSEGAAILPCQAEVADLELALIVVQDVGGFQIAMQHPIAVQILHAFQQLLHQVLSLHRRGKMSVIDAYLEKMHIWRHKLTYAHKGKKIWSTESRALNNIMQMLSKAQCMHQ